MSKVMTSNEVELYIIGKGQPERLKMSEKDWHKVYEVYRATNRDEKGEVFILVLNTRVYCSIPQAPREIDVSAEEVFKDTVDTEANQP